MATGDELARLQLDYQKTTGLIDSLTDVRFKLLAFTPTITGAAIALLSHRHSAAELLAVGSLGLLSTIGIVVYELRNTQLHDYALRRAQELERRLGIESLAGAGRPAGLYGEEPPGELTVFGVITAAHDRGLALVYSAVVAGWTYLVAWGALNAAGAGNAQVFGGIVAAVVAVFLLLEFLRIGAHSARGRADAPAAVTAARSGP